MQVLERMAQPHQKMGEDSDTLDVGKHSILDDHTINRFTVSNMRHLFYGIDFSGLKETIVLSRPVQMVYFPLLFMLWYSHVAIIVCKCNVMLCVCCKVPSLSNLNEIMLVQWLKATEVDVKTKHHVKL